MDGTYSVVNYPSQDQIAASAAVYLGGHIYYVDEDESNALIAAGFETVVKPETWDDLLVLHETWDDVLASYESWDAITT